MIEPGDLPLFAWRDRPEAAPARRIAVRRRAALMALGIAALGATIALPPPPFLVWNASASAPLGAYMVMPGATVRRGDMVVLWLPPAARDLAARRHYLPYDVPAVKRVAAVAGDRLCASGAVIALDGKPVATRRARDRAGRALPWWRGCRTLRSGELFVLMAHRPDSFDGRYFGPVSAPLVIGKARLIWAR